MKIVENRTFDEDRALYSSDDLVIRKCKFDGPADGENALMDSKNIKVEDCSFNLRNPFWHTSNLIIENSEMTKRCVAPICYSDHVIINRCQLGGDKALRESSEVKIKDCDIDSDEFGWSAHDIIIEDADTKGNFFMMKSTNLKFADIHHIGDSAFHHICNVLFENCTIDSKDAFHYAKNVTVRNCEINGDRIGWNSENVVFDNCTIRGSHPFCHCKGLRLIDCKLLGADQSFEGSDVEATLLSPVISIKNPASGTIRVPVYEELIMDDPEAKCNMITKGS